VARLPLGVRFEIDAVAVKNDLSLQNSRKS